jgi:hypothetical protein
MTTRGSVRVQQIADQEWSWTYSGDGLSLTAALAYPRLEDAINAAHIAYPQARIERIDYATPRRRGAVRRDPALLRVVAWVLLIVLIAMRLRRVR